MPGEDSLAKEWSRTLIGLAVVTLPSSLITQSAGAIQGKFFAQPWQILWAALPLAALAYIASRQLKGLASRRLDWRLAVFLGCYATIFAVLSASDLLVWKRVPLEKSVGTPSRNWLLPVTWGDWRYLPLRKSAPESRLLLLLEDHYEAMRYEEKRLFDAQIIVAAVSAGAKGVFFDSSYVNTRADQGDGGLCEAVNLAVDEGVPIMTTYVVRRSDDTGLFEQFPPADSASTPACLIEEAGRPVYRGHAMVMGDVDSTIRSIPIRWVDAPERSALSVRIAQCMQPSGCESDTLQLPDDMLLRYLPRVAPLTTFEGDDQIRRLIANPNGLAGKYLLVGERGQGDSFLVPGEFHPIPGAVIHASAVNSLLSARYFERPPAWFSAFIISAACGVLTLFAIRDVSLGRLVWIATIESLVIFALAAFAAAVLLVWLDAIYALVALWLLLPLLLGYRRLLKGRRVRLRLLDEPVARTST